MIKFVNYLATILLIATGLIMFFAYHDELGFIERYLHSIIIGICIALGVLTLLKSNVRWQSIFMGLRTQGFQLSIEGFKKVILKELFAIGYFFIFSMVIFIYLPDWFFLGATTLVIFFEGILVLFMHVIKKPFKVLLNEKNITVVTNELIFVRWTDVMKIETRHKDVHFISKLGQPIIIDTQLMRNDDKTMFLDKVQELAQQKGVYCSVGELITGARG